MSDICVLSHSVSRMVEIRSMEVQIPHMDGCAHYISYGWFSEKYEGSYLLKSM